MMNRESLNRLENKIQGKINESVAIFVPPGKRYYECRMMFNNKLEIIKIKDTMLGPAREVDFYKLIRDNYPEYFL